MQPKPRGINTATKPEKVPHLPTVPTLYGDVRNIAFAFLLQSVEAWRANHDVAHHILTRFLRLFDTNRHALYAAYSQNALFSCQILDDLSQSGTGVLPLPLPIQGRNLRACELRWSYVTRRGTYRTNPLVLDRGSPDSAMAVTSSTLFLKCGPQSIVDCFLGWMPWVHGQTNSKRFVWDVSSVPVTFESKKKRGTAKHENLLIVCHGDLVNPQDHGHKVSFDRSFLLTKNAGQATS